MKSRTKSVDIICIVGHSGSIRINEDIVVGGYSKGSTNFNVVLPIKEAWASSGMQPSKTEHLGYGLIGAINNRGNPLRWSQVGISASRIHSRSEPRVESGN